MMEKLLQLLLQMYMYVAGRTEVRKYSRTAGTSGAKQYAPLAIA